MVIPAYLVLQYAAMPILWLGRWRLVLSERTTEPQGLHAGQVLYSRRHGTRFCLVHAVGGGRDEASTVRLRTTRSASDVGVTAVASVTDA